MPGDTWEPEEHLIGNEAEEKLAVFKEMQAARCEASRSHTCRC